MSAAEDRSGVLDAWDEVDAYLRASSAGKYVRLQDDGDTCTFALLGDPVHRQTVYTRGTIEDYDPRRHDGKPDDRWRVNVYDRDARIVRIFDMSKAQTVEVVGLKRKGADLRRSWVRLVRKGTRLDTRWHATAVAIISDQDAERLARAPLYDLAQDSPAEPGGDR